MSIVSRMTFSLNEETAAMLKELQAIDGFNASYIVRRAIKEEYGRIMKKE